MTRDELLESIQTQRLLEDEVLHLPDDLSRELGCRHGGQVKVTELDRGDYMTGATVKFACTEDGCSNEISIETAPFKDDYWVKTW